MGTGAERSGSDERLVEQFGVEPIPKHLRTVGLRDLFALTFTFNLTPLNYVFGAIAVTAGNLPFWWAATAIGLGTVLANLLLVVVARAGVDYGLPGQVAMRATFGQWGARLFTSAYKIVASAYWFAAQALAGAFGIQAVVEGLSGRELPLVPVALGLAAIQAILAAIGFDALRYIVRVILPLMVLFTGVIVGLYLSSDDPRYNIGRVSDSPEQSFTWVGFASFVTVMLGAQLSNATNIADFSRYARSRREMQIGFLLGAATAAFGSAWVGAYAAVASGNVNPFVAVSELTASIPLLLLVLVAIFAQTTTVNIMNVYTGGLSLVNSAPRLGRFVATIVIGAVSVALSAFPDFINEAEKWITHLGNVAAPLAGVIVADYVVLKRMRLDVPALYDPNGRYRYVGGVNPAALFAVAIAVAVYYLIDDAWFKAAWGIGVGALGYLALAGAQAALVPGTRSAIAPIEETGAPARA